MRVNNSLCARVVATAVMHIKQPQDNKVVHTFAVVVFALGLIAPILVTVAGPLTCKAQPAPVVVPLHPRAVSSCQILKTVPLINVVDGISVGTQVMTVLTFLLDIVTLVGVRVVMGMV